METYIFIREYKKIFYDPYFVTVPPKTMLYQQEDGTYKYGAIVGIGGILTETEITYELSIHLLKLDADLFKTAFHSFGYNNWITEFSSNKDEDGNPLYPSLTKSPETVIMYLMNLGVRPFILMDCMYGAGNKYQEYLYLVDQFGKMV